MKLTLDNLGGSALELRTESEYLSKLKDKVGGAAKIAG